MDAYWNDRLTYPTGHFNPAWLRAAARQDARIASRRPSSAATPAAWTALGPQPERMTGCTGCFDYSTTEGRINAIVDRSDDDHATARSSRTPARVGGGVWKTTNCCSSATTWTVTTDDPLISTIAIDTLDDRPERPQHDLRGHGRPELRLVLDGQPGHPQVDRRRRALDGARRRRLRPGLHRAGRPVPAVRRRRQGARRPEQQPARSSPARRRALFISYDGGVELDGAVPRRTASRPSARTSPASSSRTWAADARGSSPRSACAASRPPSSTTSAQNGANGLYSGDDARQRLPDASRRSPQRERLRLRHRRHRQPVRDRRDHERRQRDVTTSNATTGDQLGRIDIAVAPSNPNDIYAQVQSIAPNSGGGCGNAAGCQLGVWATNERRHHLDVHGRLAGAVARQRRRLRLRLSAELVRPGHRGRSEQPGPRLHRHVRRLARDRAPARR